MPPASSFSGGHVCVLKQTSGQSIALATDVKATWDTLLLDTGRLFSAAANTKITVVEAGWYTVGAALGWSANNASRRTFWTIFLNSAVTEFAAVLGGSNNSGYSGITIEGPLLLAAGDFVEVDCFHDGDGGAATLQNPCRFWAYRMPW